ncbi:hypothetical protein JTB14_030672 [Gonioctena quinquepunctata]|nr:hypothetical protein JTB14_030672 [Gonioctena quinquepunctata]
MHESKKKSGGVERQLSAEPCHIAEGGSETEALLNPKDVTLTEIYQDIFSTGSGQERGGQDQIGSPAASDKQRDRRTSLPNGGPSILKLLQANIQPFYISLIQEPWAYQAKIRGMGQAGGSLFYCTTEARLRVCIQAKNVDATPLPGFCQGSGSGKDQGGRRYKG